MEHQSTDAAGVWIFLSPSHPSLPLPPSRAPPYFAGSICSIFHIHSPSPASNHSILNQQCAEGKAVAADGQKHISFFNFFFFTYFFLHSYLTTRLRCAASWSIHGFGTNLQPTPMPLQPFPRLPTCKEAGVPVRLILLGSLFQNAMTCIIGVIIPSSLVLELSPEGQSFILFVLYTNITWKFPVEVRNLCSLLT